MSQPNEIQFTQEQMDQAASQEEIERLSSENKALRQRVVILRAMVNHLQTPQLVSDEDINVGEGVDALE